MTPPWAAIERSHRRRRLSPGRGRVLDVSQVSVAFGAVRALDGVTVEVKEGAFVGLIGPNGAGKTTFFNVISGFVATDSGRVRLAGRRIDTWSPAQRARAGLARTFQNIGLDKQATVADNVRVAKEGGRLLDEVRYSFSRGGGAGAADRSEELLHRLGLTEVLADRVDELPIGTAKLVELVCALARRAIVPCSIRTAARCSHPRSVLRQAWCLDQDRRSLAPRAWPDPCRSGRCPSPAACRG